MPTTRPGPAPLWLRLLSIPTTVVVLVLGLWVTGGQITNDFGVAMWLSAGWIALAGLTCLAVAVRSTAFRWPVLGAFAVSAAIVGVYLGRSVLFDDEVNERVATAAPPSAADAAAGKPQRPRNVQLRTGGFESVAHRASGIARVIDLARGGRVLTLTDFDVSNGPDLRVLLVAGPARTEGDVDDYVDLGGLKGNKGNQQYEIPDRVDLGRYSTVVIWCRAFSVLFARAPTAT